MDTGTGGYNGGAGMAKGSSSAPTIPTSSFSSASTSSSITSPHLNKPKRNYYDTLGVTRDASQDTVKKAYQKLALQYHPDRNIGKEEQAQIHFHEVSEAYEIISDPTKRAEYDRFGHLKIVTISPNDIINTFSSFFQDSNEIFNDFFNNSFGRFGNSNHNSKRPRMESVSSTSSASLPSSSSSSSLNKHRLVKRGQTLQATVPITFEESVQGGKKIIQTKRVAHCEPCEGTGFLVNKTTEACLTCRGTGMVRQMTR